MEIERIFLIEMQKHIFTHFDHSQTLSFENSLSFVFVFFREVLQNVALIL